MERILQELDGVLSGEKARPVTGGEDYREILNSIPVPVSWTTEEDGKIYYNKAAEEIREEEGGRALEELFGREEGAGECVCYPSGRLAAVGGRFYRVRWCSPGKYLRSLLLAQDVTELQRDKELFESFVKQAPIGIYQLRIDDELTIQYANNTFYEMRSYTREQMKEELEDKALRFIHPDDRQRVHSILWEAAKHPKKTVKTEMRVVLRTGKVRWMLMQGVAYSEGARSVLYGYSIDITDRKLAEEQTRIHEERYRIAISLSDNCVWEYDVVNHCVYQTNHCLGRYGLEDEVIREAPGSIIEEGAVHPHFVKEFAGMFERIDAGEKRVEWTGKMRNQERGFSWTKIILQNIFDDNGKPVRAIAFSEDIDAMKSAELLYQQEMQYRSAISARSLTSYEINLDEDRILESIEETGVDMLASIGLEVNCRYSEFLRLWAAQNIHPEDRGKFLEELGLERLRAAFHSELHEVQCEYRSKNAAQEMIWVKTLVHLIRNPLSREVCGYVSVKDIDKKKRKELELKQKAERDPLTGLYNRLTMQSMIQSYMQGNQEPGKKCVMLIIDIDNFKMANDTFGHVYGDEVLREFGERLLEIFRGNDIIGRLGGDEFLVFLKSVTSEDFLCQKAQKICNVLRLPFTFRGNHYQTSGSVGIVVADPVAESFESLYEKADQALYTAKRMGKNRYSIFGENDL